MKKLQSLNSNYFKDVYDANEDPWDFETSECEKLKYDATLNALPRDTYESALEIGCSIGVFTKSLAQRCRELLATDVSEIALEKAKKRCEDFDNITFKKASFPTDLPEKQFDLIVISEMAYYLSAEDWEIAMRKLLDLIRTRSQLILVHWLPEVHDYPQTGDEVHESFEKLMKGKMKNIFSSRAEKYRIDVWENVQP